MNYIKKTKIQKRKTLINEIKKQLNNKLKKKTLFNLYSKINLNAIAANLYNQRLTNWKWSK